MSNNNKYVHGITHGNGISDTISGIQNMLTKAL